MTHIKWYIFYRFLSSAPLSSASTWFWDSEVGSVYCLVCFRGGFAYSLEGEIGLVLIAAIVLYFFFFWWIGTVVLLFVYFCLNDLLLARLASIWDGNLSEISLFYIAFCTHSMNSISRKWWFLFFFIAMMIDGI